MIVKEGVYQEKTMKFQRKYLTEKVLWEVDVEENP
jgi:hypothetical protein